MTMLEAGRDALAVRTAYQDLVTRLPRSTPQDRQAVACDLCNWLRFAWGPGRATAPRDTKLDELTREVLTFLTSNLHAPGAETSFCGLDLDLSAMLIEQADFSAAVFNGGKINFQNCRFGPDVTFAGASFTSGCVSFDGSLFRGGSSGSSRPFTKAHFSGAHVSFRDVVLDGGVVSFDDSVFESGVVDFTRIQASAAEISFVRADFSGTEVSFTDATFGRNSGAGVGRTSFALCRIRGGEVRFTGASIEAPVSFAQAKVTGGRLSFDDCQVVSSLNLPGVSLAGGQLSMKSLIVSYGVMDAHDLLLDGGTLTMDDAKALFGRIDLGHASFLRGQVSLRGMESPYDGFVELPWARYTGTVRTGKQVKDATFDGRHDHDFIATVARYRTGVIADWGPFRPQAS